MRFKLLGADKPKNGQRCVVKQKINGRLHTHHIPQTYWDDVGFYGLPSVTQWTPCPEHVAIDPTGWKSEYRGDDLPSKNCECLVCTEKSKLVQYAYFHDGRFLRHPDVLAFMEI